MNDFSVTLVKDRDGWQEEDDGLEYLYAFKEGLVFYILVYYPREGCVG